MESPISNQQYSEALDWLYSQLPMFSRVGGAAYKATLETTENLDKLFGHPHKKFKSIHVGGTNGKGSTSHFLASVLQHQGYKTGLYTSPHLTDFRERMKINGKMIPKENVVKFVDEWRQKNSSIKPSFFELTMIMAFDWFAKEKVDFAIIEVGMGGRLDSTNVITPLLSVITNISFDHTQFLGNTLSEIAREKAGIIKKGIPVVIGESTEETKNEFIKKAGEESSKIYFSENFDRIKEISDNGGGWTISLSDGVNFSVALGGEYQKKNIRTALTSLQQLKNQGIKITDESIVKGFENVISSTGLRGRWQKISDKPIIICDTGHNQAGIRETLKTLSERYPGRTIRFVIGFVNDKDIAAIVELFPANGIYYFTEAAIPRAMTAAKVSQFFSNRGINGTTIGNVRNAMETAISEAKENDVIYVGGSTFVVADLLDAFSKNGNMY